MNSSGESAAREQWIGMSAREVWLNLPESCAVTEPFIADIIARHYAARAREEWIPVSERLPEEGRAAPWETPPAPATPAPIQPAARDYEYPPEVKSILDRCEANVVSFSNDDVSALLVEIDRLAQQSAAKDA